MKLQEIKDAVNAGVKVYWKQDNYEVIKNCGDYDIKCISNDHLIGLTWRDGITMNGNEEDFYIGGTK